MVSLIRKHFSKISLLLCAFLLISAGSIFRPRWQTQGSEAQLSWDAGGYYWYLPATFIYHDLKSQRFKDTILQKYQPTPGSFQYAFQPEDTGNYVMKYTMGTAILESPAFFTAHALATHLGYPADGFSKPYQAAVYVWGILFALVGLWYLRKLLLFYYNDYVVGIVLLLLVFGSNYLDYAGVDIGMTHTWLFTLSVLVLYNTHLFYTKLRKRYVLNLGFLIGLAALIRPPEIIILLVPLFWNMEKISNAAIKERLRFLASYKIAVLIAFLTGCAILSLQVIYWKWADGHWFVYSYQEQGFSWFQPHFKKYALNYQSGWLMYTPVMFFAIIGIPLFIKRGMNKVAIICLIIVNYYVVAAWDAWDYGGRAMVQSYPVLLFPLASFVEYMLEKKLRTYIALPFLLLFTYFNLWWTYPDKGTLMGSVPSTGRFYWNTIFRYDAPLDIQKLRDNTDEYLDSVKFPQLIYFRPLGDTVVKDQEIAVVLPKPGRKTRYLRAIAKFSIGQKEWDVWYMTQFMIQFRKNDEVLQENSIRVQRLLSDGESKNISIDAKIRPDDYNNIRILFRNDNMQGKPCRIDSLKVFLFDE